MSSHIQLKLSISWTTFSLELNLAALSAADQMAIMLRQIVAPLTTLASSLESTAKSLCAMDVTHPAVAKVPCSSHRYPLITAVTRRADEAEALG